MNPSTFIVTGAFFGLFSVILGAFGAHALKKVLTPDQQHSFEVGVRYQMYHAIVLLALGLSTNLALPAAIFWCFTIGILLFSFSIYGLILSDMKGNKLKILGPVTPVGGLLFVAGWILLIIHFI